MRESCEPPRPALQNPRGDLSADAVCEKPVRAGAAFATNQSASRRQAIGYGGGRGLPGPMPTDIIEWRWPDLALRLEAEGLTIAES